MCNWPRTKDLIQVTLDWKINSDIKNKITKFKQTCVLWIIGKNKIEKQKFAWLARQAFSRVSRSWLVSTTVETF